MIAIRPATEADGDAIARVHVDSWHRAYDAHLPGAMRDQVRLETREAMWHVLLGRHAASHPTLVAAADDGGVVGFAMAGRAGEGVPGFAGEIHMVFVAPGHQRRDLGRRLFLGLVPVLAALGCGSAFATVLETPQALGFFAAMGGQRLGATQLDMPGNPVMQHLFGWRDLARLPLDP